MNIQKGERYKTVNGGSVRIIADDRLSMNGKHWVGLYDGDNGEWIVTYDADGTAYVFDTVKPDLSIKPEKRKFWMVSYVDKNGILSATAWHVAPVHNAEYIQNWYKTYKCTDVRVTLVEQ